MSYNISNIKVYENNLRIKKVDMEIVMKDCGERLRNWFRLSFNIDETWKLDVCDGKISGHIEGDELIIESFRPYGEGSGTAWTECLQKLLKATIGSYKARYVWEGGDSIYRVECINGILKEEEIE